MIESIQSKKKPIKSTNTRTDTQSTQHGRPWLTAVRKPSASRNRRPVSARKRPRPVGISTLVSNRASGPHHRAETATVTQLPDERPLAGPVALSEASRAHCPPGFGAARPRVSVLSARSGRRCRTFRRFSRPGEWNLVGRIGFR